METSDMRIPPLVVSLLLLGSGMATAQGLEYRVRMHMDMPGMEGAQMPTPEMTMFMQGANVRVDNSTRGMSMSIIMDGAKGQFYYLDHNAQSYRVEAKLEGMDDVPTDTAALRARGMMPEVISTSDTRTILGYNARRFVTVMRIPNPAEPGSTMISINESWISTDPKLKDAFQSSLKTAERILGPAARELSSLMPPGAEGVPLETNILMVKRGTEDKIDALALLKDPNPAGLMTRARMETLSVKLQHLPDSLFAVPASYKKAN
jgi:hypothetical protein